MSEVLFSKGKDSVELYGKLDDVKRLFHRQTVGEGISDLFTALLEAQRKVNILSNDILLTYCGDYTDQERKALELSLSKIGAHLLYCVSSVELFGMFTRISKEGEETLNKINEAIAKAKDFKELSKLLKEIKL